MTRQRTSRQRTSLLHATQRTSAGIHWQSNDSKLRVRNKSDRGQTLVIIEAIEGKEKSELCQMGTKLNSYEDCIATMIRVAQMMVDGQITPSELYDMRDELTGLTHRFKKQRGKMAQCHASCLRVMFIFDG